MISYQVRVIVREYYGSIRDTITEYGTYEEALKAYNQARKRDTAFLKNERGLPRVERIALYEIHSESDLLKGMGRSQGGDR